MRRRLPSLVSALGGLLVLVGVVVFALANRPHEVVYEGSYEPLSEVDSAYESRLTYAFDGGWSVTWTSGHLIGVCLLVLGLLGLAALGGWVVGRRAAVGETRD